jgi:GT2 family glycosyltransferase
LLLYPLETGVLVQSHKDTQNLTIIFKATFMPSVTNSGVRLGFIVPTMNRLDSLNRLLTSIYQQDVKPEAVIIVDGSDEPLDSKILRASDVPLIYVREFPPSLTRQRNAGIRNIPDGLTHVGFLDDDLQLLPGSISAAINYLESHDDRLGGVSFNIMDKPGRGRLHFLMVLMGQASFTPGKICPSGFATGSLGVQSAHDAEWLCGGATIWRKEILDNYKFDEWYNGYALWEDVDFSYRVSKSYRLVVLHDAKVLHLHQWIYSPERSRKFGDLEIVDRFYFVSKFPETMSYTWAIWASFWAILRNLRIALKDRKTFGLNRTWANVRATVRCALGHIKRQA